ncbi:MAG: hypothetical protein LBV01_01225 [Deltaproteobacteria bacterium]|nr:hypothetical protein [Deltaproteobacteria bacterium]
MEQTVNKERIRNHLRTGHSDAELQTWFDPLALRFADEETLEVGFPHLLFSRWFDREHRKVFEREVALALGKRPRIVYVKPEIARKGSALDIGAPANGNPDHDARWSFDTFIYNKKNEFPVAMAREAVSSASAPAYIPFVISGKGICGKTHLLRAIASGMALSIPQTALYFGTAGDLYSVFAENKKFGVFKRKMLRYKAIFLDDAQHLESYPDLQQELVFILDAFREKKKNFILAVDKEHDLPSLAQKFQSRLESGLVVALKKPDLDVRLRYTRAQCAVNQLRLTKESMLPIAQRFQNFRAIQGIVVKLAAYQQKHGGRLTAPDMEKVLASSEVFSAKPATPALIISQVAEALSLSYEDVIGNERRAPVVYGRQIAMYLCRELLGLPFSSLGLFFTGKNHATVLYAFKKIKNTIDIDKDTHKIVTQVRKKFISSPG